MRRTFFSLAILALLAACNGSSTDTMPGDARFDGMIGSGVGRQEDSGTAGSGTLSSDGTGQGQLGGGTRAESDTTGRDGSGMIGSGT